MENSRDFASQERKVEELKQFIEHIYGYREYLWGMCIQLSTD